MIRNYIKITWRNLKRNGWFSFINIGGLALGMTVVIIIGLWVLDDFTFNQYHKNYDRIGQIYHNTTNFETNEINTDPSVLYTFGSVLKEKYPEYFKYVLRSDWVKDHTLSNNGKISTKTGTFIESGAIEMFSLQMIKGTNASLDELNAIVLSESAALAIFGQENPIGKSIKINNEMDAVVKGVFEDLPKNTRFRHVQFFANWNLFEANDKLFEWVKDVWDGWYFNMYVELKPGVDIEEVNKSLQNFYIQYGPHDLVDSYKESNLYPFVYPMNKWHLYSEFEQGIPAKGRITFVWLFIYIAIFVLLLACINFISLSTARSDKRAKEVGVRKTMGSKKNQLVYQFLIESLIVSFIALLFALILISVSLPWFNELSQKDMSIPWGNALFWSVVLFFTVFTGLFSGIYPAFILSSFNPIKVIKGTFRIGKYAETPRKVLVIFQFSISIMLAVGTFIVFEQIQFTKDRPIGYDGNDLIYLNMNNPDYFGKYNLLRDELKNAGVVEEIAQSFSPQTAIYNRGGGFNWPGKDPEMEDEFGLMAITHDYGKTVGWKLIEGRDFSREMPTDSSALIVNEAAVKYMKLKKPVGTYITYGKSEPLKIIAVAKNMVMESPYKPTSPAIYYISYSNVNFMHIKLKSDIDINTAITETKRVFAKVIPSANFDYRFVNQDYNLKFRSEQRLGNLASVFTLLAILISCLGLFGLTSFAVERRTKQIGIRRVLGASKFNIWKTLSSGSIVLVLLSCLIGIPIIHHFMEQWLQNYNYRMEISWWIYGVAIIGALLLTLLTVSFQIIKAASINPIKSLRTE